MTETMDAADLAAMQAGKRGSKYKAQPVEIDGMVFDSKLEGRRYEQLKIMRDGGVIADLEVHPAPYRCEVNGVLITKYTPDFRYFDCETGKVVVEDTKSAATRTRAYVMRRKLVKALFGVDVREVTA